MQIAIDPADRKLLLITGTIMFLMAAALAVVAPPTAQQANPIPSIYSTTSGGARAAYLLLRELHFHVEVWDRPPTDLPEDPDNALLIIADPVEPPGEKEQAALLQFVKSGGRILFTGSMMGAFFRDAKVSEEPLEASWQTFDANFPSNFTVGAPRITMQPEAEWATIDASELPLYGAADSATVVSWRLGDGELEWWAGPTPLTNAGITLEGNLNLFLDAVRDPKAGASEQPNILWDEYFHGERASLWGYVQKTPIAWGLLQIAILGLAVLFTFSRRSGPIAVPAGISRLWPLEFIDTLGGLYQRAHAEPAVIGVVYQRFRSMLTQQLRLPATTPDGALAQAVRDRLGSKDDALPRILARAATASRAPKIPPAEALEIIRSLERLEEQLGLKKKK